MAAKGFEDLFDDLDASLRNETYGTGESVFEPITAGFANIVCRTSKHGRDLVIKRYTDLVFLRLPRDIVGAVDTYAGQHGIGPNVLFSSDKGIIMEELAGKTLEESDVHRGDLELVQQIADELATFHQLPIPDACAGEPMLWRTVDKMMEVVKRKPDLMPDQMPSIEAVEAAIQNARTDLQRFSSKIVLGHGDFKPSNVMKCSGCVKLIDFELGGPNYRGFDVMKLFRSAQTASQSSMRHFLLKYAEKVEEDTSVDAIEDLLCETQRFEPLTWLEAAVFFLTLQQFKPEMKKICHDLAVDRWGKFLETKHKLTETRTKRKRTDVPENQPPKLPKLIESGVCEKKEQ